MWPRSLGPQHRTRTGTRADVWRVALGAGSPPLPRQPVCEHPVHMCMLFSPQEYRGEPSSMCKAVSTELGASLFSVRGAAPPAQLAPGPSSNLEPPVTYFPLLLFLEVLMSMQNSAERLSEKKGENEGRGRRRRGE